MTSPFIVRFLYLNFIYCHLGFGSEAWYFPVWKLKRSNQQQQSYPSLPTNQRLKYRKPTIHVHVAQGEQQGEGKIIETREDIKRQLCDLLQRIPRNQPTSAKETSIILSWVELLENSCPTLDEQVLKALAGNWELVWTSVDPNSLERKKYSPFNWIK